MAAAVSARFLFEPVGSGTEFRLEVGTRAVPFDQWALDAPETLLRGAEILNRLVAEEQAVAEGDVVLVDHAAIAAFSAAEASALQLPPLADAMARIATEGLITQPSFRATLQWCRPGGQTIVMPKRIGAWLRIGQTTARLSAALFAIAVAVDKFAAATELGDKLISLARLREVLPEAVANGNASGGGLAASIAIVQAERFSLDLVEDGTSTRLVPILHAAEGDNRLLSDDLHHAFADGQFNQFGEARSLYTLPGNVYLAIPPTLRKALQVVRRQQSASRSSKRDFLASPRRHLREAFETEDDPTLVEAAEGIFVETAVYSDRVVGLGLWAPRVVPWLARPASDWFGPEGQRASSAGISIDGQRITLAPEEARSLVSQVQEARAQGQATLTWTDKDGVSRTISTAPEIEGALEEVASALGPASQAHSPPPADGVPQAEAVPRIAILIASNEGALDHEDVFAQRVQLPTELPATLRTPLKMHQLEGVQWLMHAWHSGRPGVLLADDMGLGKTLQGLTFLAWLRQAMEAGRLPHQPLLIVAPTGLLANWGAEQDRHFVSPALGRLLPAYGAGLRSLRVVREDGSKGLNRARIAEADWVVTTYETLRDYDADFGAVHFAAMLMDEAQKVKTPAARMTDAAKGMRADFKLAMTGTPVENRLADLWCIVDGVHSGYLQDLKTFSATYEVPGAEPERIGQLKARLERPFGGAPALMLRRLRKDRLPDLPEAALHRHEEEMPAVQATAYRRVIDAVRQETSRGAQLAALHQLRAVCLHPSKDMAGDDGTFINASARLRACIRILDAANTANEAVLVFLEDLEMQSRLAGLLQRRYALRQQPDVISGEVAGPRRQAIVDRFQAAQGFGMMLISPKAGGVGLTLTRANHVIHLTRWWNPAVEDQCSGRALRIGQLKTVNIHLPTACLPGQGRTFDHNLDELLERKRRLMQEALIPPGNDEGDGEELFRRSVNV